MASVRDVVGRVGPTLLRVVAPGPGGPVVDVVIPEGAPAAAGDLVLGVGVVDRGGAVELVRLGGAAVLLKPPLAEDDGVLAAAAAAGVAVVEVRPQASWAQLVHLLRSVLDAADDAGAAEAFGDLFRLADAAAAVVDAPVTIEDAHSRVLAYSARQDGADRARQSTIMGRRVPRDVLARFRSRGVFRELSRGRPTVFVPAQQDGTLPRLVVPIRMGGELLGSMWAVVSGPVPDERAAAFADTAPVVALHLLRRRAREDGERTRAGELVRAALAGTGSGRLAAAELDLGPGPHRVVAVDAHDEGTRLALAARLTEGIGRRTAIGELHGLLYAIVPDADWPALRAELGAGPQAAAGSAVGPGDLARGRAEADEALALLRAGLATGPVVAHEDAWAVLVLHRAATAAGPAVAGVGPLTALDGQDGWYRDTLYEWLRHPGDPRAAAAALSIHTNTLRYRMARVVALLGVDLGDPDTRLALLCQLVAERWR
ncbi:PucR family transcriptional regulator [Actinokineospora bangkokensis]|uniref:PucR family transcriptional regulator n=1 Tax=Actinokineospora bangkokensis TaxID=1193682 RepID=A0A1Q9LEA9_9PSEU|nr:helix-turn-helix domain-containing protein [Actinokineospora bangkokensis]OLR90371.1 PucR family transcriptional regulator [Actinokineospora bangkokensis]